jgi:hypothetical protein
VSLSVDVSRVAIGAFFNGIFVDACFTIEEAF